MPGRVFVDTNIWLYALVQRDIASVDERHRQAVDFLGNLSVPVINSQVIREACSNLLKKCRFPEERIQRLIQAWYLECEVHPSNASQHLLASQLRSRHHLSYWDSLIVAAAIDAGCTRLYSEDMQHGMVFDDNLSIINPFASKA
jgi:predicted nucleic acid-binding protein